IGKKIKAAEDASRLLIEQQEAGYDFIKVHMGLCRTVYDAAARTSTERRIPFVAHVTAEAGLQRALELGQPTIGHLNAYWPALVRDDANGTDVDYGLLGAPPTPFLDEAKFAALAEATRQAGVWNVPTLSIGRIVQRPATGPSKEHSLF
ncbi:MAG: hypothetical protein OER85_18820, partial [Gammaproteobacteria bacterium]|nr:hypothetical protein [Gammaproteobacteria bacterium]